MIVGVGEWGFRELPFEEHCRIARKLGFQYMEVGIGGEFAGRLSREMSDKDIRDVLECSRSYDLSTPFVCLENDFTLKDAGELETMKARTLHELELCRKLGATHVRLFTGFARVEEMTEERWNALLQALLEMDEACERGNMVISIETHGQLTPRGSGFKHAHTTSTDKAALMRLIETLPERIGFNFDPGNLKPFGNHAVLLEYVALLNPRINYCHLKDWKRVEDYWLACGVGDDDMNWVELLGAMQYNGVYLIEYEPTEDVEDGIRRSLSYLQRNIPSVIMGA